LQSTALLMGEHPMEKSKGVDIEQRWKGVQRHLGFTEEELGIFRSNPANVKAMEDAPAFASTEMVVEVIEAHNCAAGYKAGDKFTVNSEGMLVPEHCPRRLCVGAIFSFKLLIDRMWQAFFDNSTQILHDTVHCPDVGVHKGGAGTVLMRIAAAPKGEINGEETGSGRRG
jgi:uncharacterized repeat protein (TIGR04076 family)